MRHKYFEIMEANPVIAAIKDEEGLKEACMNEEIKVVFILYGDICTISGIVQRVKDAGKIVFVHMDLIHGLSQKEVAVDFIVETTRTDGIITTRQSIIDRAVQLGLCTILRYFVIDSLALENVKKQNLTAKSDFIEILPGVMPKIIEEISKMSRVPVIAGGLIRKKKDVMDALNAGAISVSSTNRQVWTM